MQQGARAFLTVGASCCSTVCKVSARPSTATSRNTVSLLQHLAALDAGNRDGDLCLINDNLSSDLSATLQRRLVKRFQAAA